MKSEANLSSYSQKRVTCDCGYRLRDTSEINLKVSIELPHRHPLPMTWASSRGVSGENFHWISEQFLDLYYLNADQLVSAKI